MIKTENPPNYRSRFVLTDAIKSPLLDERELGLLHYLALARDLPNWAKVVAPSSWVALLIGETTTSELAKLAS